MVLLRDMVANVFHLTKAQKRDLLIISEGNVCSKTTPMPFRRCHNTEYIDVDNGKRIRESMIDKLMKMDLIEDGVFYRDRCGDTSAFNSWGRFIRLTQEGRNKIIKIIFC